MKKLSVDYEDLLEWMMLHKIHRKDLAKTAASKGAPISAGRVGQLIRDGRAMPGEVIMAWQKAYGWTDQETMHFCLGGECPRPFKDVSPRYIAINIEDLKNFIEEIEEKERRFK